MKLIVCLDERNGMRFLGRRQSQDAVLRQRMLALAGDRGLWMDAYSAKQFPADANIRVDEAYWLLAEPEDYCFAELAPVETFLHRVEELVIYRWNRHYPADGVFPMEQVGQLLSRQEFAGSSHDCITEEVYKL